MSKDDADDIVDDVRDSYDYEYLGYRYEVWEPVEIDTSKIV